MVPHEGTMAENNTPKRIQLHPGKGWRMPPNTVKADRTSKWGNPFVVSKPGGAYNDKVLDRRQAWQLFTSVARENENLVAAAKVELRGKKLA
jgi:Domain of unknown function (DUF4326)